MLCIDSLLSATCIRPIILDNDQCQKSRSVSYLLIIAIDSVSDLLDYINPSHDAKGKDAVGSKRRNYIAKVFLISLIN